MTSQKSFTTTRLRGNTDPKMQNFSEAMVLKEVRWKGQEMRQSSSCVSFGLEKGANLYRECALEHFFGRGIQHVLALMFGVNSHVARCLLCAKSYGNEGKVNDKCETMRDGETTVTLCESEAFSLSCFLIARPRL